MQTLKVEVVVPDWVNWIAVDENGGVWYYANLPNNNWFTDAVEWSVKFGKCDLAYTCPPPKNWKEELYTWS